MVLVQLYLLHCCLTIFCHVPSMYAMNQWLSLGKQWIFIIFCISKVLANIHILLLCYFSACNCFVQGGWKCEVGHISQWTLYIEHHCMEGLPECFRSYVRTDQDRSVAQTVHTSCPLSLSLHASNGAINEYTHSWSFGTPLKSAGVNDAKVPFRYISHPLTRYIYGQEKCLFTVRCCW